MKTTTIHIEDVTRAARHGVVLALAVSLLSLAALLLAGLSALIAVPIGLALLAIGAMSGGFGLVGRLALPLHVPARRSTTRETRALEPLRVPQTR